MAKDAKWYAGWLRTASTPTAEEKLTVIETAEFIENLASELEAVKRERDYYRNGLKLELGCNACRYDEDSPECFNNTCMTCENWEWRGVQENGGEE